MGWASAIGGIASAIIGKKSSDKAAETSMTGYNYLLGNETVQGVQEQAPLATQQLNQLIGMDGSDPTQSLAYDRFVGGADLTDVAFDDFRTSTNYDWRVGEGMRGITGNAAAAGLLNSGATAKALVNYNQNMGAEEYGNFVNQQSALQAAEANGLTNYLTALQNQQSTGLNAAYQTAAQGQAGGATAAGYQMQGAENIASGLGMAFGGISDWWSNRAS